MFVIALLAAGVLAAQPPAIYRKKPHRPPAAAAFAAGPSVAQERALRRRVIRLARIKMLERRQAMLLAFLAKSHTETPLFENASAVDVGGGVLVGPTTVTLDFLGSPIIRAEVRNASKAQVSPVLTARLRTSDGQLLRVSVAIEALEPGATHRVELLSPSRGRPTALTWTSTP
jgi:hypothetical protein